MNKEEARHALAEWAIARSESDDARDFLVREAVASGLNKRQIHLISGIARTTINDILKLGLIRGRILARQQPDEHYLRARDSATAAADGLDPGHDRFFAPGGIVLWLRRKPVLPLRAFVVFQIARSEPDVPGWTLFNFERGGRVAFGGNRRIPIGEVLLQGHEAWASSSVLEELAGQLRAAVPEAEVQAQAGDAGVSGG